MGSTRINTGTSSAGGILLLVIGLPFFGAACVMGYLTASMILDHQRAQDWVEVPARIETVELKSHTDSEGSTTYRVICAYSYEWESRAYSGERVGLSGGSDNIGSWHEDTYQRLHAAHKKDLPVPCYVNPADPAEAVLDRDLRFPLLLFYLLFVTVFGAAGIGLVAGGIYARRRSRRTAATLAEHPDEPWLHKPEWAEGVLRSNVGMVAAIAWVIAIFWNVVSLPAVVFALRELRAGHGYLPLLGLLFPLIGMGLLAFAVRKTLQKRKFGGSHLKLETIPGVVGGHLRGELVIAGDLRSLEAVDVALKCVRAVTTGSGKNRRTTHTVLWQDARRLDAPATTFGQAELRLPVAFQIPYTCEPHDHANSNNTVTWKFSARADVPGVDLDLDFDVPVFRTADSDASVGEAAEKVAARQAVVTADEPPPASRIRRERDFSGAPCLAVSSWPGLKFALLVAIFAFISGGVAIIAAYFGARGDWFLFLFTAVFGAASVALLWLLSTLIGIRRITLAPGELRIERQAGPLSRHRVVARDDVVKVIVRESASSGETSWYGVYLKRRNGRKITLAGMVPDELSARWLARQVEQHCGIASEAMSVGTEPLAVEDQ